MGLSGRSESFGLGSRLRLRFNALAVSVGFGQLRFTLPRHGLGFLLLDGRVGDVIRMNTNEITTYQTGIVACYRPTGIQSASTSHQPHDSLCGTTKSADQKITAHLY